MFPTGRRQLQRSRRSLAWRLCVPAVWAVAGLLGTTSALAAQGTDLRAGTTDLSQLVAQRAGQVAAVRADQEAVRREIDALSDGLGDATVDDVVEEVDELAAAAGLRPVQGPGAVVVLDDTPLDAELPKGVDPNLLIVHQQDIQAFVNALWAGGAQGITLQGQRLTSTTGIKCVGNSVVLEGVPYAPPYRIVAVGDAASLQAGLESSDAVRRYREYVRYADLGLDIDFSPRLFVPGYEGSIDLVAARPVA